ncbi:MAG: tetratricopeptide repeat protein [Acidiferrobacteraceae bacterium]
MKHRALVGILTLALVAACAMPVTVTNAPESQNPAVTQLMQQAQQSAASGHPRTAEGLIERALRIAPHNPYLWHELAKLRLARHPNEARYLATRSNTLSGHHRALRARNWHLIASALAVLGHPHRAAEADSRAQALADPEHQEDLGAP